MPNGYHPQEPPQPGAQGEARVGVCPRCSSARIRTRRHRHWSLIWRCRRCRRTFAKPRRVGLSQARDLGRSPVYEGRIRRLESRSRRKFGGRHGLTLGCLIWLVILMACAGIMVFWLLSNEKISSVLPPSATGISPSVAISTPRIGNGTRPSLRQPTMLSVYRCRQPNQRRLNQFLRRASVT